MLTNPGLFLSQERRVKYTDNRMSSCLSPGLRERREAIVRRAHCSRERS
jgi:hypothetical protein